jgi:hypothetical protein
MKRGILLGIFTLLVLLFVIVLLQGRDDFITFYIAGLKVLHGQANTLYRVDSYPRGIPFVRPAWQALVFVPFSLLTYKTAFYAWTVVSLTLFGLSVWLMKHALRKIFLEQASVLRRLAILGLLIPAGKTLVLGQDTAVFLLLLVMALRASKENRDVQAGIWFGLASIDLHLIVLALLLALFRGRFRMILAVAATGTCLLLLSFAVGGPGWILACLHSQATSSTFVGIDTLRYALTLCGLNNLAILVILSIGIILSFWLVWKLPFENGAAWLVVASVFFAWHAFGYDYVAALPAFVQTRKDSAHSG